VVVADMQMPGMNGIQFSRRRRKTPDTVRIMLTGNSEPKKTAMDAVTQGMSSAF